MTSPIREPPFLSGSEWDRAGRGRRTEFFATDEEILDWLAPELSSNGLRVVGYELERQPDRKYVEIPYATDALPIGTANEPSRRWKFYLQPVHTAPDIHDLLGTSVDATLSVNGLIQIQHGLVTQAGVRERSSVGLVDRVRNLATGEVIVHDASLKLYRRLVRSLKPRLTHSAVWTFADGSTVEDTGVRMTNGAFDAATSGELVFAALPGERIKHIRR
jgi:hypothetical protein